jgi:undecaprenyl-diphosphatase
MNSWQAVILGLIQGLAEFLPISSSGHLALVQTWLQINPPPFWFDTWIHLATLMAVIWFFRQPIKQLDRQLLLKLSLGTIPVLAAGALFHQMIGSWFSSATVVAGGLMMTGVLNLATNYLFSQQKLSAQPNASHQPPTKLQSLLIGLAQATALVPGISRSGSTLFAAAITNQSKTTAFQFSFLLSIPAIIAANLFHVWQFVQVKQLIFNSTQLLNLLLGGLTAFITSLFSLVLLKKLIGSERYIFFGLYCLLLGSVILLTPILR